MVTCPSALLNWAKCLGFKELPDGQQLELSAAFKLSPEATPITEHTGEARACEVPTAAQVAWWPTQSIRVESAFPSNQAVFCHQLHCYICQDILNFTKRKLFEAQKEMMVLQSSLYLPKMEMFGKIGAGRLSASCICLETVPTWTLAAFYIKERLKIKEVII